MITPVMAARQFSRPIRKNIHKSHAANSIPPTLAAFCSMEKGISLATGDLIWIAESDDFCEPDFLEKLVPSFADDPFCLLTPTISLWMRRASGILLRSIVMWHKLTRSTGGLLISKPPIMINRALGFQRYSQQVVSFSGALKAACPF